MSTADFEDSAADATDATADAGRKADRRLFERAGDLKEAAKAKVAEISAEKPDPYEDAVVAYNDAFTLMADAGQTLLRQRERSTDLLELIEGLINSVANTPKSFAADLGEISANRVAFNSSEDLARQNLEAARVAAFGAGAGLAAGAAVASIAPTAAMWVATTFGTASTGTAISALSGAAANSAALAWLGGGTLLAGGGGTAGGAALLALAGPIGWTVAGATLLASVALFTRKKIQSRNAKQEDLLALDRNTAAVQGMRAQIDDLLDRTTSLRMRLMEAFTGAAECHGADFLELSPNQQVQLAALVNNAKSCAALLGQRLAMAAEDPVDE